VEAEAETGGACKLAYLLNIAYTSNVDINDCPSRLKATIIANTVVKNYLSTVIILLSVMEKSIIQSAYRKI
jgi:hypothetical protein